MCLFAGPVEDVSKTSIAVLADKAERFTAYQMSVELAEDQGNAMILPVPAAGSSTMRLVDMSKCKDFFTQLDALWPKRLTKSRSFKGPHDGFLEVHRVGDYEVSIASNVSEIRLVDPKVFTLSAATAEILAAQYPKINGWSFIVAKLVTGGELHPLGYTYTARDDQKLFVPTLHEHGDPHEQGGAVSEFDDPPEDPFWDHTIYLQGPWRLHTSPSGGDDVLESGEPGPEILQALVGRMPVLKRFLNPTRTLRRLKIRGRYKNTDIVLDLHKIQ